METIICLSRLNCKCPNDYIDDDMVYDKSLLDFHHLYHKRCVDQNDGNQWKNNMFKIFNANIMYHHKDMNLMKIGGRYLVISHHLIVLVHFVGMLFIENM